MIVMTTTRNAHVWREIAYFLGGFQVLASQRHCVAAHASAHEKRSAGADEGAGLSTLPDGNHGEITQVDQA